MSSLLDKVIYNSAAMQQMHKGIDPWIKTASPILFWGEAGAGMGFYAGAIHEASRAGKLLRKPCFELDEKSVQEQLLGVNDQRGWLEECDHGTIFFKRVTKASPVIQKTLLHLLEIQSVDGRLECCRKGTTRAVYVNVRFIFSMAEDYDAAIREGLLLRDFADILKKRGKIVQLPPLRQRKEDIVEIAKNLLEELDQKYHRKVSYIAPQAQKLLTKYHWPGNIDELKRTLNAIFVEYPDMTAIAADNIPEQIVGTKSTGDKFSFTLEDEEKLMGKILSKSLLINKKKDNTKFRINTDTIVEIMRVEDTSFTPPRFKHFVLKLKDGDQLAGEILDKTIAVGTNFNPNYQINPRSLYEVVSV